MTTPHTIPAATAQDIKDNKAVAMLSYLSILCFVPLLLKKDSAFAQFHAKQGLALFISEAIVMIVSPILSATLILIWVPIVLYLVFIVASLYGLYTTWNGEMHELPGVEWVVKKFNL